MVDSEEGTNKRVAFGNVGHNTTWPIKNLPLDTYYWGVHAVDNGFRASLPSEEKTFKITTVVLEASDSTRAVVSFQSGTVDGYMVTFDSYGATPPNNVRGVAPPFSSSLLYFDFATTIPDSVTFTAQVRLKYTDNQLAAAGITDETMLAAASYNRANFMWKLTSTTVDTAANTVIFTTSHFSTWALGVISPTGIEDIPPGFSSPYRFELKPNYPNPFNSSTIISYAIPGQEHVRLIVYNVLGQEVSRLVDQVQMPGRYTVVWNGTNARGLDVSSGIYLYNLTSSNGYANQE
jgi:hypothetical protein